MKLDYTEVRRLLRTGRSGALGSISVAMSGYPFVSLLPYGLDERGRPLFLLSRLAEHTKNLLADPRASLMISDEAPGSPLESVRLTLLGTVGRVDLDEFGRARFLRYSPNSAEFLDWGDFSFFRMEPQRARFIGGFGRMGWLDAVSLNDPLQPGEETALLEALACRLPAGMGVEGLDPEGVDLVVAGVRRRIAVEPMRTGPEALLEAACDALDRAGLFESTDPPAGGFV
ncbi:pyridoxamine 5'-phosphate oxidase family protein [Zoogloea sp.]|uniref:HugZ family pyridoxamine 5'-phosphate oxidase n=1 Tax=Zoogloea sp. TaxID=49181 RepID=UPI001AD4A3B9|nr:pyridoxamine 5'-phosphate oxidase family protein [Zoogloea sp.]MBN8282065.1 pyridoxamine 5'-phosphate oxidase family protein [Zoogloea sp.]